MAISKLPNGKWLCQCFPDGRNGRRVRHQFTTKGEAMAYERQLQQKQVINVDTSNIQKLSELVNRWYELHGKTLRDGSARKTKLEAVCERLNNPLATDFDKNMFAVYREDRLNGKWYGLEYILSIGFL
ncbi:phage integrase [Photorhabdus antumapuensis]|uniref:phage integrase n=1 Tax=Photorhabdus antumapuensis TaxID=2862867 RepID=UPI001CEC051C|nr:integrase [Photorhabdus antumapuensis]MCA6220041.1 integrase [Photorhabdus antumapuensis]